MILETTQFIAFWVLAQAYFFLSVFWWFVEVKSVLLTLEHVHKRVVIR